MEGNEFEDRGVIFIKNYPMLREETLKLYRTFTIKLCLEFSLSCRNRKGSKVFLNFGKLLVRREFIPEIKKIMIIQKQSSGEFGRMEFRNKMKNIYRLLLFS